MNLRKHDVPEGWRINASLLREIRGVDKRLIRIAKALARDLGETNPDAYYYYVGPAVEWRNANRIDDSEAEFDRVTLVAEGEL